MQTTPTTRTAPHLLKPITAGRCGNNNKTISAERQIHSRGFYYKNVFSVAEDAYYIINNEKSAPPKKKTSTTHHENTFRFVEKYLTL